MREAAFQETPNLERILQLNLIFHFQLVLYSRQTYQIFLPDSTNVSTDTWKTERLIWGKSKFRSRVSSGEWHELPPSHSCFPVCPIASLRTATSS